MVHSPRIPAAAVGNTRNDMYLTSEAIRFLLKDKENDLSKADIATLGAYKKNLDGATKFIPDWVKVSVALALGLGTMIGWKRIVVTVGEKIGKQHMTYGQGAAAEIVAMATIGAADSFGLPVSTTHVLSSGVAGTMAANGSGVQMSTVRSLVLAWVLTLPCAIGLSAFLFFMFSHMVRPDGACCQWRKIPPRELSIDLVADERIGWVTGRAGAS
jgi:inorganic phosphate transporter, PiT family